MKQLLIGLFVFTVLAPDGRLFTITDLGGNLIVIGDQSTGNEILVARQRNGVILMPSEGEGSFLNFEKGQLNPLEQNNPFDLEK